MKPRSLGALLCVLGGVVALVGAALPWYDAKVAKLEDVSWSQVIVGIFAILTITASALYLRDRRRYAMGVAGALAFSVAALVIELISVYDLSSRVVTRNVAALN